MKTTKNLGIWMDHSEAYLLKFDTNSGNTRIISFPTASPHPEKQHLLKKREKRVHNIEQQKTLSYYKKLGATIIHYQNVILFGATDAKTELFHFLRSDHHFDAIKIDIQDTDKMTENQREAFVKDYFSRLDQKDSV
ncbi:MAG TPA: hypothetical protein PK776_08410 [Flavobacterium sp.]|jgi:hypothetical protein|nr:hypothetical protein [Flavobacterium sp.]